MNANAPIPLRKDVMASTATTNSIEHETPESWMPMVAIGMGQAQMSLNVTALPISIGGIVETFNTAPTTVGTAIVAYSMGVSAFVILAAKIGQKFGSLKVFRLATAMFLLALILMTFSPNVTALLAAQGLAGLAAAAIVPSLVVLIANNYKGKQQAKALGILGAVQAMATVTAFFVAGVVGTFLGWRYAFGIIIPFSGLTLLMSMKLKPVAKMPVVKIDAVGAVLAAVAIVLISVGLNNINSWGLLFAKAAAPFALMGLSPALFMAVFGVICVQLFVLWAQRRQAAQLTPLLALEVVESPQERSAALSMMSIVVLGNALMFLVPLYIQMVQGRSSFDTSIAMIPYQLAVFAAAILVVSIYDRLTPRQIASYAFAVVSAALLLLAFVMNNAWSNLMVISGLVMFGLGQGALVTLLFNVLVTASPKELAGDVGSLRGTINNLSAAVGTALAGALVVGILSANIMSGVVDNPAIPPELKSQVNLDNATFVSNDRLLTIMQNTTASPEQIEAAVRINAAARLRALKLSLFILACVGLLVIIPARRLPNYRPGEVPAGPGGYLPPRSNRSDPPAALK